MIDKLIETIEKQIEEVTGVCEIIDDSYCIDVSCKDCVFFKKNTKILLRELKELGRKHDRQTN